ncbi:MAG: hypothetical protein E6K18_00980 [Methanobacteriota archaeon]|nr:MAG: hypothetical protein E6K18_00980 [Euryarchaeota archaeon]
MDERYFLRILLGTSVSPKSAQELSRIYHVPMGLCTGILEYLAKRGYVSNVVTLFTPDGQAVKYYLRTDMRLRGFTEAEALPPLSQSPV